MKRLFLVKYYTLPLKAFANTIIIWPKVKKKEEKGRKEGRKENKMEIALRLLQRGKYTLSEIQEDTKLTEDDIRSMAKENNIDIN